MPKFSHIRRTEILERQLDKLTAKHNELADVIATIAGSYQAALDRLAEQLAESNLRLLFVMRRFKFGRQTASPVLDANGNPSVIATHVSLDQLFYEMRDEFEKGLRDEFEQQQAQQQRESVARDVAALAAADLPTGETGTQTLDGRPDAPRPTRDETPNANRDTPAALETGPRRLH